MRNEYGTYSINVGYQTVNTALRDARGDMSKFDDPEWLEARKDFEGNDYGDFTKERYIRNLKERIRRMDEGMEFAPEIPEPITLSRGTRWQEFKALGITGEGDDLTKLLGKSYIADSYTSTSVGGKAAMDWMPVQITLNVPKGTRGVYMAGDKSHSGALSSLPSENEFLLPRGTKYKITDVVKNSDGSWDIEVEVLKP